MSRAAMLSILLICPSLIPAPARADAALYSQCATAISQLKSAGVIRGIVIHGAVPLGFDLLVNQGKWQLIDAGSRNTIVHLAACYAARGNGTLQVSGIVHDAETNRELGAMGMSGEYFPHVTGPGFSP